MSRVTGEEIGQLINQTRAQFKSIATPHPVFLNSVPKSGTMLLRNILLMFWDSENWILPFVEPPDFEKVETAAREKPVLCTGHVNCTPVAVAYLRRFKKIILIRDPGAYALSYARFLLSENMRESSKISNMLIEHGLSFSELVPIVISGIMYYNEQIPSVRDQFLEKCLAWTGSNPMIVRYEDLCRAVANPGKSRKFFEELFSFVGISLPRDWQKRVKAGADAALSTTATENLTFASSVELRRELLPGERNLLEVVAPGLRGALGY